MTTNQEWHKPSSAKELRELCNKHGELDCIIQLAFGAQSRKTVRLSSDRFEVEIHIDDTTQLLTDDELNTESNIALAMQRGAFFVKA